MAGGSHGVRARFVVPAVVCLLWLLPSTASAQCWYEAAVYAALYDNGVDHIEAYGAGWDGSYCPPCPHNYQISATLWLNSAVVADASNNSLEVSAGYGATQPGWASYEVLFIINCPCAAGPIGLGPAGGSQQVQRQPIPTGETSTFEDWMQSGGNRAKAIFRGHLVGGDFGNRDVVESDYAGANDDCHFTDSIIPKTTGVSGGNWFVQPDNSYGPDSIGWPENAVIYYRGGVVNGVQGMNQTPCSFTMYQRMAINVVGGAGLPGSQYTSYKQNVLKAWIRFTTIESIRDGVSSMDYAWP